MYIDNIVRLANLEWYFQFKRIIFCTTKFVTHRRWWITCPYFFYPAIDSTKVWICTISIVATIVCRDKSLSVPNYILFEKY